MKITYICKYCEKSFIDHACNHRVFCSESCRSHYVSTHFIHPCLGDRVECICKKCSKAFYIYTDRKNDGRGQYCSTECRYSDNQMENHPLWKGGSPTWRGSNWPEQSSMAKERDNFICQECGETNKNSLLVHHIKPFSQFKKDWKLANDISNLITLCRSCHGKKHPPKCAKHS